MVNFHLFRLVEVFVYPKKIYLTLSISKDDIIWGAWSRRYLNQEKAYATL